MCSYPKHPSPHVMIYLYTSVTQFRAIPCKYCFRSMWIIWVKVGNYLAKMIIDLLVHCWRLAVHWKFLLLPTVVITVVDACAVLMLVRVYCVQLWEVAEVRGWSSGSCGSQRSRQLLGIRRRSQTSDRRGKASTTCKVLVCIAAC